MQCIEAAGSRRYLEYESVYSKESNTVEHDTNPWEAAKCGGRNWYYCTIAMCNQT
jgi:hypothetical protein